MITTSYTFNGQPIGGPIPACSYNALPTFLRVPTRHTLDDLMKVRLDPSKQPIVLTFDPPPLFPAVDWDSKLKDAFLTYYKLCEAHNSHTSPAAFSTWHDRMKWRAYTLLRKIGMTF